MTSSLPLEDPTVKAMRGRLFSIITVVVLLPLLLLLLLLLLLSPSYLSFMLSFSIFLSLPHPIIPHLHPLYDYHQICTTDYDVNTRSGGAAGAT